MKDDNQHKNKRLSWRKVALMYLILMFIVAVLISIFIKDKIFFALAASVIISWIIGLVAYYFWAIHFYNVNLGWKDSEWKNLEKKKRGMPPGLAEGEPDKNPHAGETLGLPPGTVRATIALTLLVGSLALMLASLEMPNKLEKNQLFIDNYEFIKTAFLMIVAFYFGNKSIEALQNRNPVYGQQSPAPSGKEPPQETLESPVRAELTPLSPETPLSSEITDDKSTKDFEDKTAMG